ncbi:MAG TPA: hypothetical protein VN789_14830 [Casimicrobiaceae bacterium]|nr:hypothetical protein [Casimicrobiaceae bacterium]
MLRGPLIATLVLAAAVAAFWITGSVGAAHKLAPLEPLGGKPGNYAITLDFAPERFHQQTLQDLGRVVEVKGATVYMKDVEPAALKAIARRYWVDSVARWNG